MDMDFPFWGQFVEFCQALIQTPSPSGEEDKVASIVQEKMKQLSYDDVWIDRVGNVIGLIRGDRDRPSVCFTAHMDHVDPGDETEWEYPPYSGAIADGYIHGRGASDLKGPLATQVYIPELLKLYSVRHGDLYVIEVVQEEVGGLGSRYLDESVKDSLDYVINGEPTSNMLKIGHRGRIELVVRLKGKSVHASMPGQDMNPIYDMAAFISKFRDLEMAIEGNEKSTATPTICRTDQKCSNVTPGKCELTIDWRNVPSESEGQVIDKIRSILPENAEFHVAEYRVKTYTNANFNMRRVRLPYSIERNSPFVIETEKAVKSTLNREVEVSRWPFSTDCGCFMDDGIPTIGFSPAEEKYVHTNRERISLKLIKEAMKCYPAIVSRVSKLEKRKGSSLGK